VLGAVFSQILLLFDQSPDGVALPIVLATEAEHFLGQSVLLSDDDVQLLDELRSLAVQVPDLVLEVLARLLRQFQIPLDTCIFAKSIIILEL